jgi:hypothetical protein
MRSIRKPATLVTEVLRAEHIDELVRLRDFWFERHALLYGTRWPIRSEADVRTGYDERMKATSIAIRLLAHGLVTSDD